MKTLAQGTVFLVFAVVAGVVGLVVWAGVEVVQRALDALDMIGPGLFVAGALACQPAGVGRALCGAARTA